MYCYCSRKNKWCNHFKKYEKSLVRRADKIRECGKKNLNPEEEDLDKDAIDNEDIEDDPTVFFHGC